ncbi:MAG: bifunctional riboflavin kinase/FAD synthetase [Firmicutes bacterium]|nr:bifunctional riboflavin kinase/FAD synthetase [Bacillota bacterium]
MILYTSLIEAKEGIESSAAALGNFDGVHKGHQALISECVKYAKEQGISSVVFTFLNHPINEMAGECVVKSIMTLKEKAMAVEALGVDIMVAVPFNDSIRTCSPEDFVKNVLCGSLGVRQAFCGFNYNFGYRGEGDPSLLQALGRKYGFGVTVLDELGMEGKTVSSTLIRMRLAEGDVEDFRRLTGRLYTISGRVIPGEHFGRKMGFPTINLALNHDMALPANGVYITNTFVNNSWYKSVTNVGNKPSVGKFAKNAETHIFSFSDNVYGQEVRVEFIKMLRPELKFETLEDLSAQIEKDCVMAREYHGIEA